MGVTSPKSPGATPIAQITDFPMCIFTRPRTRLTFLILSLLAIIAIQELNLYSRTRPNALRRAGEGFALTRTLDADTVIDPALMQVDWSRYAYVVEATNPGELCDVLQLLARLQELGCRGDRVVTHPPDWSPFGRSEESRMLLQAKEAYGAKFWPRDTSLHGKTFPMWTEGIRKIHSLNQTQYDRVLGIDPSSLILQCLDELFLLPTATLALPFPVWNPPWQTEPSFQLMLVEKSSHNLDLIIDEILELAYDTSETQGVSQLYLPHGVFLSHAKYGLTTNEMRSPPEDLASQASVSHAPKSGGIPALFKEAKFVHFSKGPLPGPRTPIDASTIREHRPKCPDGTECLTRELWLAVYSEYKRRCIEICGIDDWHGSIPAATNSIDEVRSRLRAVV